jgi:hypothetical protein
VDPIFTRVRLVQRIPGLCERVSRAPAGAVYPIFVLAARRDQPLTLYAICKERNLPPVLCHPGGGTQLIYALRARPRAYS